VAGRAGCVKRQCTIYQGSYLRIECLVLADGSSPAWEFLQGLDDRERRRLAVLFEMLGDTGRISNREKFKKLEGSEEVWEFKSFQIRMPCFFTAGRVVMLLFGLRKKSDRWKRADVRRAEEMRRWYFAVRGHDE
jgi:hypothetical protein